MTSEELAKNLIGADIKTALDSLRRNDKTYREPGTERPKDFDPNRICLQTDGIGRVFGYHIG